MAEGYDIAENTDTMVLRSFHLPQSMDDQLRELAFALRCAKADLQRFFISTGLQVVAELYGRDWRYWDDDVLDRLAEAVQARGGSESVKEGIRRDIARMGGEEFGGGVLAGGEVTAGGEEFGGGVQAGA
jgi:hypothetical protein